MVWKQLIRATEQKVWNTKFDNIIDIRQENIRKLKCCVASGKVWFESEGEVRVTHKVSASDPVKREKRTLNRLFNSSHMLRGLSFDNLL